MPDPFHPAVPPEVTCRHDLKDLSHEQRDGRACVVCGRTITGSTRIAVARTGIPRHMLYTCRTCKPRFRLPRWPEFGCC